MTLADRRRNQRRKKARNLRNGIVPPPATKRSLNKTPVGNTASPSKGISRIARASTTGQTPTVVPLENLRAQTIEDVKLGIRPYNALKKAGIHTVGQLIDLSEADLLGIKGIGQRTIDLDIVPKLAALDARLKLKEDAVPALAA
ncbi:MAG TPA: DNA-directed RNA polymerase subunit alpha C-terminal domain-containing protein [Candidatus Saccharimonadales bacterium]|nr:DNA-directed RNA polymerase subunit alpha C-terminal domain-containing protein [Candidatus Saccharimonadales bacterium]